MENRSILEREEIQSPAHKTSVSQTNQQTNKPKPRKQTNSLSARYVLCVPCLAEIFLSFSLRWEGKQKPIPFCFSVEHARLRERARAVASNAKWFCYFPVRIFRPMLRNGNHNNLCEQWCVSRQWGQKGNLNNNPKSHKNKLYLLDFELVIPVSSLIHSLAFCIW